MTSPNSSNGSSPKHRRYRKPEKVAAIVAAEASSIVAASDQTGIPESTIRYWLDKPEFAELRANAREAMAEEARVVARLAWRKLGEAVESGELEPRDLVMAAGMATDKAQLLSGGPTARTETRSLGDDLSDDEKQRLREWIDSLPTDRVSEGDPA